MKHLFWALLPLFLIGCAGKSGDQTSSETTETQQPVTITLTCHDLGESDMGPSNEILLNINGTQHVVDTIQACEDIPASGYASYEIPADAAAACGGWWAGASDYFYARSHNNSVEVFQGWQDEGQTDNGYHWKLLKSYPLP